jgi:hypothetical protein
MYEQGDPQNTRTRQEFDAQKGHGIDATEGIFRPADRPPTTRRPRPARRPGGAATAQAMKRPFETSRRPDRSVASNEPGAVQGLCTAQDSSHFPATAWARQALGATADESQGVARRGEHGDRR